MDLHIDGGVDAVAFDGDDNWKSIALNIDFAVKIDGLGGGFAIDVVDSPCQLIEAIGLMASINAMAGKSIKFSAERMNSGMKIWICHKWPPAFGRYP